MKKVPLLITLIWLTNIPLAQAGKGTPFTVRIETKIKAPADKVWKIIGKDFANIDQWAAGVKKSWATKDKEIPKGIRIDPDAPVSGRVTATGIGEPKEFLINFDNDKRTFTFQAFGLPKLLFKASQNQTTIIDNGDGSSTVRFDITAHISRGFFFLKGPFKKRMKKAFKLIHQDLKYYAENDDISPAKKAALAKAAAKKKK